jgi:RNA polymerase sigma-70 factor (ECF subfamily)
VDVTANPGAADPGAADPGAADRCADPPPASAVSAHRPDEFGRWVRPALLAMTRLATRLAPSADVDDVVQDALARAWRKWDQFDPDRGTPTTWLLAITADQARSARRRRVRRLRVIDDQADLPDAPSSDVTADVDLERAIGTLPPRQALAVHVHYFLGLSVEDTAAVMGCGAGTVKSTLHDARQKLRVRLEGDGGGDRGDDHER